TATSARLENFEVLWRQMPKGKGGQEGAAVAFSPDGQYLFLSVGKRMRFTPAQDPDQPSGKILRLTLDGKPAPGNPNFGATGAGPRPCTEAARGPRRRRRPPGSSAPTPPPRGTSRPPRRGLPASARRTAWRSRRLASCGRSSTVRAAATN